MLAIGVPSRLVPHLASIAIYTLALSMLCKPEAAFSQVITPAATTPPKTKIEVAYPLESDEYTREFDAYFISLLTLALEKSSVNYQLIPYPIGTIVESRSEHYIRQNRYDIHWMNTTPRREGELLPIRIPLFKGLIGWRLMLIRSDQQLLFNRISTLAELRSLTAGQGHDWPDTPILQANQIKVLTSTEWESLFYMLQRGRMDYFPRSVIEIWREQEIFKDLDLQVEEDIALNYQAAYYFFVNKQNEALARAVENGLHKAIDDGSFDALFFQYFADIINKAQLEQRRVLTLKNPLMFYPSDPKLWFTPSTTKPAGNNK